LHEQEVPTAAFFTEGIELKPTYSEQDIENLDHLDFGGGFLPFTRSLYYYVCVALGPFVNMLDFQHEESNAFIDVILLQDKRTIDCFRFADTPV
jgi:hypothetical protein